MNDEFFMKRALQLAYSNLGDVSPNPSVGAIVVKGGKIISEGVTQKRNHAEVEALSKCDASGATLYVTLEPCSHENKKTPPCTQAIIKAGVKRVVVGVRDENPEVSGVEVLEKAGIEVVSGVLEKEARKMHEFFFKWIKKGIPFVTLKTAVTLDGKMTWGDGVRKRITGEEALRRAHELRRVHDAILVGVNTVIKDDPKLTCRLVNGRNPLRVVLDSNLRMPKEASLFKQEGKTVVFCTDDKKAKELEGLCEIVVVNEKDGNVDVGEVLKELGRRGITSVMVEGGAQVTASFLNEKRVDKIAFFVTPETVEDGRGFFGALKEKVLMPKDIAVFKAGDDVMIEGYL